MKNTKPNRDITAGECTCQDKWQHLDPNCPLRRSWYDPEARDITADKVGFMAWSIGDDLVPKHVYDNFLKLAEENKKLKLALTKQKEELEKAFRDAILEDLLGITNSLELTKFILKLQLMDEFNERYDKLNPSKSMGLK